MTFHFPLTLDASSDNLIPSSRAMLDAVRASVERNDPLSWKMSMGMKKAIRIASVSFGELHPYHPDMPRKVNRLMVRNDVITLCGIDGEAFPIPFPANRLELHSRDRGLVGVISVAGR
jgi:hypothetical protein